MLFLLRDIKLVFIVTCVLRFWFLPNPPITIFELPNCACDGSLTFLRRWCCLVEREYNTHVT